MLIISTDKYTLYFDGWKPNVMRNWYGKEKDASLSGSHINQVVQLKTRLRFNSVSKRINQSFLNPDNSYWKRKPKSWSLFISNDTKTLFFSGKTLVVKKTFVSGVETAILRGSPEKQVEELKARLRSSGIKNNVTSPEKPKRKRNKK